MILGHALIVAKFELLFYKILKFTKLVILVIINKYLGHLETSTQHSSHGSKEVQFHKNIVELFDAVNRKSNPMRTYMMFSFHFTIL